MSGPPDMDPADLWRRIVELPRPTLTVDFPRMDPKTGKAVGEIALRVLTHEEQLAAAAAAEGKTRKLLKEAGRELPKSDEARQGYEDCYNNCAAAELVYRAARRADKLDRPFFPAPAALDQLTVDEIGVLLHAYYEAQATLGPLISKMSADDYKAWVAVLAEGAAHFPFERLTLATRLELLTRMASELWKFWTATPSPTEPPASTSMASAGGDQALAA